jgi:hypothetical protein
MVTRTFLVSALWVSALSVSALSVSALLSIPSVAGADVIDIDAPPRVCPPMACPPGSHGVGGGHSGCPYDCSAPTECDDAHPCSAGSVCEAAPVSVCIETVYGGNYAFSAIREACVDGACPTDQTCWTHRRCMPDPSVPMATPPAPPAPSSPAPAPPPAPTESTPPDSGGCSARTGRGTTAAGALMLAMLLSYARRRRAGPRSGRASDA